ncbi:hypothetical protein R5R35_002906 [Gryllus longicercus]|uniref:Uncharacterized protein n=1 Tax=Gryllus longicercus TaxID=2509291 RepID=A0AAN9VYI0_9ORTH
MLRQGLAGSSVRADGRRRERRLPREGIAVRVDGAADLFEAVPPRPAAARVGRPPLRVLGAVVGEEVEPRRPRRAAHHRQHQQSRQHENRSARHRYRLACRRERTGCCVCVRPKSSRSPRGCLRGAFTVAHGRIGMRGARRRTVRLRLRRPA